jgi:hypothetical protein
MTEWLVKIRDTKALKINNLTTRIQAYASLLLADSLFGLILQPRRRRQYIPQKHNGEPLQNTQHHIPEDTAFVINTMGTSDPIHYKSFIIFTSAVQSIKQ